ncbi:unnamed protein product, partial [Protopolystoma xenopodis]
TAANRLNSGLTGLINKASSISSPNHKDEYPKVVTESSNSLRQTLQNSVLNRNITHSTSSENTTPMNELQSLKLTDCLPCESHEILQQETERASVIQEDAQSDCDIKVSSVTSYFI